MPVLSSSKVSTSPAASTARPAHGENVFPEQTVDAGDADGGEQSADRRGNQTDEQRDDHGNRYVGHAGVKRHGHQRDASEQKDERETGEQNIERDLVGVFCRSAPSTRAIMRSRKDSPGLAVMRTTIRSDSTFVPPVTAERSPPLSRMTGADSPVMADSSTDAMPSITSPSPGMISPASTTTVSPLRGADAGTDFLALTVEQSSRDGLLAHLAQASPPEPCRALRRPLRRNWRKRL